MNIISLTLNGILVAAMYALGRAAARDGMSPLGLLYWQALSSAVIVSAMALLSGDRPRFPRRYLPRYAMAVIAGVSPVLLTGYGGFKGFVPGQQCSVRSRSRSGQ